MKIRFDRHAPIEAVLAIKLGLSVLLALLIPTVALAYDQPPIDVIGPASSAEARAGDRESFFPLLKSIAKGRQLPKPYGISLVAAPGCGVLRHTRDSLVRGTDACLLSCHRPTPAEQE